MNALQYLDSLIIGQEISTLPVQLSELKLLRQLMAQPVNSNQLTDPIDAGKKQQDIDTSCTELRRLAGLPYPRTCPVCKLGPCQNKETQKVERGES